VNKTTIHTISLFLLIFAMLPSVAAAQIRHDYRNVDQRARSAPAGVEEDLVTLVGYLTENLFSERNKARAIFTWITDRISYDVTALENLPTELPSPDEVLYSRKAICTGYAILFDEMSRVAGLETELIIGHSKGLGQEHSGRQDLTSNHIWNAIKIDGHWSLFDPTWGAGYVTQNRQFIPSFNDFYFMADPFKFVYTHLPENPDWQLLVNPVSRTEYMRHVWVRVPFFKHRMTVISHRDSEITSYGELQIKLGVPGDVIISAALKFEGSAVHGSHIVNYGGSDAQIDLLLNLRGNYSLEIYARHKDSGDERLELAMVYHINNVQTPVMNRLLARQYGSFLTARGNLISPRQYILTPGRLQFDIVVPGAREVYVVNNDNMTALHQQGNRYYGTVSVYEGELKLAARFSGQDVDILIEYIVTL
jgi:transglutaminase/protease-like cytokinesis protein 3